MGADDADAGGPGECPGHDWSPVDIQPVERDGVVGMAIVNRCQQPGCDATWYEPSNVDRWPETKGLDPRI